LSEETLQGRLNCWTATKLGMYKSGAEIPRKGWAVANSKLVTSVTAPQRARSTPQTCSLPDLGDCPFSQAAKANTF